MPLEKSLISLYLSTLMTKKLFPDIQESPFKNSVAKQLNFKSSHRIREIPPVSKNNTKIIDLITLTTKFIEKIKINNIYNIQGCYSFCPWSIDKNKQ